MQVVLHDVNIATLLGPDIEKIKSIARSETCVSKVHSSTTTMSPMFLFYTSNERLFKHTVGGSIPGSSLPLSFPSQAQMPGKKRVSSENLEAIKARFLEMFCHKAPKQDKEDLKRGVNFDRSHFLLGTTPRAMALLEKYQLSDFPSNHLPAYIISALTKNADFIMGHLAETSVDTKNTPPSAENYRQRLASLKKKYNVL